MGNRRFWTFILSVVIGSLISGVALTLSTSRASRPAPMVAQKDQSLDDVELYHLFEADQSDRLAVVEGSKAETQIREAEGDRLKRGLEYAHSDRLKTASDFYRAAVLVQRSHVADEILLAHDLALTAVSLGEHQAAAIAASTEDRFLITQGMRQRFGTQFEGAGRQVRRAPVANGVTDTMRERVGVPPLMEPATRSSNMPSAS